MKEKVELSKAAVRELQLILCQAEPWAELAKDAALAQRISKAHAYLHRVLPGPSVEEMEKAVFGGK